MLDTFGQSKGYGFVKFTNESEFSSALRECQHADFVGSKPIYVRVANFNRSRPSPMMYKSSAPPLSSNIVLTQSQEATTPPAPNGDEMAQAASGKDAQNFQLCYANYEAVANAYMNQFWYSPYPYEAYGWPQMVYAPQGYFPGNGGVPNVAGYQNSAASHYFVDHGQSQPVDAEKMNDETMARNDVSELRKRLK